MSKSSLTSLMNDMVGRLDDLLPEEETLPIPEERYWDKIGVYMRVDPVLAQLYKQYCEAKDRLGALLSGPNSNDPMTEIAWDMHDSVRSAIDTRLIEMESNPSVQAKIEATQEAMREQARAEQKARKAKRENDSMENIINFLIWTCLVFRDRKNDRDLIQDFAQAS